MAHGVGEGVVVVGHLGGSGGTFRRKLQQSQGGLAVVPRYVGGARLLTHVEEPWHYAGDQLRYITNYKTKNKFRRFTPTSNERDNVIDQQENCVASTS